MSCRCTRRTKQDTTAEASEESSGEWPRTFENADGTTTEIPEQPEKTLSTTYPDISHQLELLGLCRSLNRERDRTVVLVLHDLNQACRFAEHLIVMQDGAIVAQGAPSTVTTEELHLDVFGLKALVRTDPVFGTPLILPVASVQRSLD